MNHKEDTFLILNVTDYKESDGLVQCITQENKYTILARGIQKITSKNRMVVQPFSTSKLTFQEKSNQFSSLLYGESLKFYHHIQTDLIAQSLCFLLHECIWQNELTLHTYTYLEHVWNALHTKSEDAYGWACLLLRDCIALNGIEPFVDGCVICGKTNHLETLSIRDGGFLCTSCNHGLVRKQTKAELVRTRSLFHVTDSHIQDFLDMYTFTLDDVIYWANWYEYHMHAQLKTLRFLKSMR